MPREQAQALLRNYAECLHWPHLQVFDWSLLDKYEWKVFINIAPQVLLLVALGELRARYQLAQEMAG